MGKTNTRTEGVQGPPDRVQQKAAQEEQLKKMLRLFFWFVILALSIAMSVGGYGSIKKVALVGLIVFAMGMWTVARAFPGSYVSPVAIFFVIFSLFHFGLIPFWLFDLPIELPLTSDIEWYEGDRGVTALRYVIMGGVAYIFGALLVSYKEDYKSLRAARNEFTPPRYTPEENRLAEQISRLGAAIVLGGLAWWLYLVNKAGGLGLILTAYQDFLAATEKVNLGYAYLALSVGVGLVLITPLTLGRGLVVAVFIIYGASVFFLGLRGEVLYPTAVALSVLSFRRASPRLYIVFPTIAVGLAAAGVAKQVRQQGLSKGGLKSAIWDPLAGLAELGQTIRVVTESIRWHEGNLEPYRLGSTYTVSIFRVFEQFGGNRIPANEDFRLFNIEIANRAGPIGGSIVGEAHHNFAIPGIIIVMFLMGVTVGLFSRRALTPFTLAIYIAFAGPMIVHVRNSFVPVIPGFLMIMALLVIVKQYNVFTRPKHPRPSAIAA